MIIYSLPYKNTAFINEYIHKFRADLYEFRLDYAPDSFNFNPDFFNSNTILTLRDSNEGGKYNGELEAKLLFYQKMVKKFNCLVDCEYKLYRNFNKIELPSENLILSYHSLTAKTDFEQIETLVKDAKNIKFKYLKIAVNVTKYSDLLKLQKLSYLLPDKLILVGMGSLGKISRILYKFLGSQATYVSHKNFATASGQINLAEAKFYHIRNIDKQTLYGGIIGQKQIDKSIGLQYYNHYFRNEKLNACYLPFAVNNFQDFWNWLSNVNQDKFFGFSITMPFKKMFQLQKFNKYELKSVNLYIPSRDLVMNTDKIAFEQAFELLDISLEDEILLYGSGATAETALATLKNYREVTIASRNELVAYELAYNYNKKYGELPNLTTKTFSLIINCTPIGMAGEDFFAETGLNLPQKFIDLPYTIEKTRLIRTCELYNIPFIDGKKFWHLQAKKQLKEFRKTILK